MVWPSGQRLAKVPTAALDRYFSVRTTGRYAGQQLYLHGTSGRVWCYFIGPPAWADAHGFTGSQHDGWTGQVDVNLITDIQERVVEL
ncbi:MAG: hypothetical protein ACRDTM_04650 [Micromonosporaceae bacterium]